MFVLVDPVGLFAERGGEPELFLDLSLSPPVGKPRRPRWVWLVYGVRLAVDLDLLLDDDAPRPLDRVLRCPDRIVRRPTAQY